MQGVPIHWWSEVSVPGGAPADRLSRRLGLGDAVIIGLGSMLGAGVFAAIGPAAGAAGSWLLGGLALAAVLAFCNATSTAQLAARSPSSGGVYVFGRERLGEVWGFLAGWAFVVGKAASCAAMALTFGAYVAPEAARLVAVAVVVVLVLVNLAGVHRTALATRVIVVVVIGVLASVVVAGLSGGVEPAGFQQGHGGAGGVLRAAGLLFFAFAGYARIATLGEEVREPERTIPLAVSTALAVVVLIYTVVAVTALATVGPDVLATSAAPLVEVARSGGEWAVPLVKVGAAVATVGVLLSLLAGVSRTVFAMADHGDLPRVLAAVHPVRRVPQRAELVVGAVVAGVVSFADLRNAIGFSSFAVLSYYAVANASAWRMPGDERTRPRWLAGVGLLGCVAVMFALPVASIVGGLGLLVVGLAVHAVLSRRPTAR